MFSRDGTTPAPPPLSPLPMPVARYRGTEVGYLEERDLEGCKALSEAVVVVTVLLVELLCVSLPYEPEAAVLRLEQDRQTDRQTLRGIAWLAAAALATRGNDGKSEEKTGWSYGGVTHLQRSITTTTTKHRAAERVRQRRRARD